MGYWGAAHPDRRPLRDALSSLRLLTYGGAALKPSCEGVLHLFNINATCSYGQTELCGPVMLGDLDGDMISLRTIGPTRALLDEDALVATSRAQLKRPNLNGLSPPKPFKVAPQSRLS